MFHKELAGLDLHAPTNQIVENNTGSTIPALKAVTYDGIGTSFPSITLTDGGAEKVRGITQAAILDGAIGYITSLGFMVNVNTSLWPDGTSLYADPSGTLVTTPHGSIVATVYKQDSTAGVMFVENSFNGGGGGGSGNVTGPGTSTDKAITRWNGTTGTLIQDSKAFVQDGGAVQAQALIQQRTITNDVTVPDNHVWIDQDIELAGGDVTVVGDGQITLID